MTIFFFEIIFCFSLNFLIDMIISELSIVQPKRDNLCSALLFFPWWRRRKTRVNATITSSEMQNNSSPPFLPPVWFATGGSATPTRVLPTLVRTESAKIATAETTTDRPTDRPPSPTQRARSVKAVRPLVLVARRKRSSSWLFLAV